MSSFVKIRISNYVDKDTCLLLISDKLLYSTFYQLLFDNYQFQLEKRTLIKNINILTWQENQMRVRTINSPFLMRLNWLSYACPKTNYLGQKKKKNYFQNIEPQTNRFSTYRNKVQLLCYEIMMHAVHHKPYIKITSW